MLQKLLQMSENERAEIVPVNSKFTESCSGRKKKFANFGWIHQSPSFRTQKVIIWKVSVLKILNYHDSFWKSQALLFQIMEVLFSQFLFGKGPFKIDLSTKEKIKDEICIFKQNETFGVKRNKAFCGHYFFRKNEKIRFRLTCLTSIPLHLSV